MSSMLPLNKIRETERVVAFYHPNPSYKTHILIVPKQAVESLLDLTPEDHALMAEVVAVVQEIVAELNLTEGGYRLIVNGGAYQDVGQLHFHLISEEGD